MHAYRCDVWEVDESPDVLVYGHSGDAMMVSWNPAVPATFATVADSEHVHVWDAERRHQLKKLRPVGVGQGATCRSVAFSPDGQQIAVGLSNGGLSVMDARTLEQVAWRKEAASSVDDLKFSPNSRLVAASSHGELAIDVYDRQQGYKKISRCLGHSGVVTHLDWSADSRYLMSNSAAYEILYHDVMTGRLVRSPICAASARTLLWLNGTHRARS